MLRSSKHVSRTAVLALVALAALVAACGTSGASGAPGGSGDGKVLVQASEFKFDPSTISVPAGSVTFAVTNVGQAEHEFEVFKGETVVDEIEGLVPGLTRDLTVTLDAGAYTYVCKLAGHEEQGMKGTLTVTAP